MVLPSLHDWLMALAGGLLIGSAAAGLMVTFGRIAGVSGMVRGALAGRLDAVAFVIGLPLGALLIRLLAGGGTAPVLGSPARLAVAGVLVGIGSGLANGCTSGHSVCGIARLSPRSLVATVLFIAVGAGMVVVAGVPGP